jgi:hypothetical protein
MDSIYEMLSQAAELEHRLAHLREKINAEWKRLGNKAVIDAQEIRVPNKKKKGNERKLDGHFLLEMARRLEQNRNLKPWPAALQVAAGRRDSLAWNATWISIDAGPYLNATAKRIYRKFQAESGKRYRCLYLVCMSSLLGNTDEINRIVERHKQRISKPLISEEDISDEYLEELRSAVAEGVRRDREGMPFTQCPPFK